MENTLQGYNTENLMAALGGWNRQESQFRTLFSDEALKDREFMKMKLSAYDRIWDKFNGNAKTIDEKAMLIMLRFQRRKMSKALYPGLLTRLVRRGIRSIISIIDQRRERSRQQKLRQPNYAYSTITVPQHDRDEPQQQNRQGHRYGQDLGRRQHRQKQGKSQSF